ncbi:thiol:disulfide interchange protein DsbC [Betaproteobacteria bacterium]|nr:thiol:disulfide interchange protein DsbC [Betaproteobacteria bacterium]GHU03586.1 thiol:disulfide interchange protein DsbC [Betaproteobacteria bacterium]GHU23336.1 thiol:disulfide interchange protein DsbC [Betaproteobacteria bacterium]
MSVVFKRFLALAVAVFGFASAAAHAGEAEIRAKLEAFFGVPIVVSVSPLPGGTLYEVVLETKELIYTDSTGTFLIDGQVLNLQTRENLTALRRQKLDAIDFSSLPLDQAVKIGNGKRVLVTFEDPNCSFCRKLAVELQQVKDLTLYTFLLPILSEDSDTKSRHIWCAKNRGKAWLDWLIEDKTPAAAQCDTAVIDRNIALARKFDIRATPTLFFADGSRIAGYRSASDIEKVLASQPQSAK